MTREVLSELLILLEQAAIKKGRYISVSLNRGQAVLHVLFTEKVPVSELVTLEVSEDGVHTVTNISG